MLNVIFLRGRLTRDPELRRTQSAHAVTNFGLAVQRDYSDETDFFEVVAWRRTAEFISRFFKKGQQILIHGALHTRTYTDDNGNKRKVYEVIADHAEFVDSKVNENNEPTDEGETEETVTQDDFVLIDDGELPF